MFTGIITASGTIRRIDPRGGDVRLTIEVPDGFLDRASEGDSIAVSGACLTALNITSNRFAADVSRETLKLTTIGSMRPGHRVNLESSLTPNTPMGGHFVTGHVDGIGRLLRADADARSWRMRFELPEVTRPLVATKGSIAIDGVSLTVNAVDATACEVNIVPHTLQETTLGEMKVGTRVNIEADLLARYVARLKGYQGINEQLLQESGFA